MAPSHSPKGGVVSGVWREEKMTLDALAIPCLLPLSEVGCSLHPKIRRYQPEPQKQRDLART